MRDTCRSEATASLGSKGREGRRGGTRGASKVVVVVGRRVLDDGRCEMKRAALRIEGVFQIEIQIEMASTGQ